MVNDIYTNFLLFVNSVYYVVKKASIKSFFNVFSLDLDVVQELGYYKKKCY